MAKIKVLSPENKDEALKLGDSIPVSGGQIVVGMDDGSRFIIHELLINMSTFDEWDSFTLEAIQEEESFIWKPIFEWKTGSESVFPPSVVDSTNPLIAYKIRITIKSISGNTTKIPGIGIDYAPAKFMITDPAITDYYRITSAKIVRKKYSNEIWFPLRFSASKIYDVFFVDSDFRSLIYMGNRSRYVEDSELDIMQYKYDPVMETVIIRADTFGSEGALDIFDTDTLVFCEYVTAGGSKAIVPIEAIAEGPMFDVDVGSIINIHPEDYEKLPQEEGEDPIQWQVINDQELQGGYQYWNSEYLDLVAFKYDKQRTDEGPGFHDGYRGSGIDFQRVGAAPDSFDKEVGDYRQFWIGPDGNFVKGLWQTKARGYVTFIGPPNKVIPEGIRVIAPEKIRYSNDFNLADSTVDPAADALSPRIPNGGMKPAPLVVKLHASTSNDFPDKDFTVRKTAAFKPKLMVYLRERTKYVGSTNWKDVGEGFGEESEQTGVPYWL